MSSASLLIVVGVVLDTVRQLGAQMVMRNYSGFLSSTFLSWRPLPSGMGRKREAARRQRPRARWTERI